MSLLTNLGLKPTPAMARRAAAAQAAPLVASRPAAAGTAAKTAGADVGRGSAPVAADDPARQAALALAHPLQERQREAQAEWTRLAEGQEKLAGFMASAKGEQKQALEAKKKLLDQSVAGAARELGEIEADIEALANPGTKREEYVAILARARSRSGVIAKTEVDTREEMIGKKRFDRHETTTKTSYADGRAVTAKEDTTRTVGLDGVTKTTARSTEETTADGRWTSEHEKKTQVSAKGVSVEEKRKVEIERGDKKFSREDSTSTEVGKEGVTRSSSTKVTRSDGSATETAKTGGVERGEGKVGAVVGRTRAETDASGNTTSYGGKGKGGMAAGKDGYGGFGEGTASVSRERPSGVKTGAVAGLNANIVCNIGEPEGDPPVYTVTLEVNLGATLAVSAGHAKKDAPGKANVEAKAGKTVFMKCAHRLSASEAAAYMQALSAASSGGTAAATHKEFAIIRAGVKQGWAVAQQLYTGRGNALSADALDDLKKGDSVEVGGGTSVAGKAGVGVKAVSVEGGVEESDSHSAKVTRSDDGQLDYELKGSSKSKVSAKVGVSSGAVEGSVGGSHTAATSTGYLIRIDPKKDAGGKLRQALAACRGQADYDAFAKAHPETVTEKTVGRSVADTEEVSLGIGGVKAGINLGSGVADETTTDAKGKLKHRKVTGSANAGGAIEIGGTKIGDSAADEAEAEMDSDGNASIDLRRKRTSTDLGKLARSKVPFLGEKKKGGALAKVAGGEEEAETETHDVAGLRLSNKDLDAIGKIACGSFNKWMHGATSPRALADWEKAGRAIKAAGGERGVVAAELARFVGGDKTFRLDMVNYFLRPDGKVATGTRYEFPEGLEKLKKDYDALVIGDPVAPIDEVLKKEGAEKAGPFGQKTFDALEKLNQGITAAKNFSQPAVRAEMLSAVNSRKGQVLAKLRELAGARSAAAARADTEAEYRRLLKTCLQYKFSQDEMFAQIKEWHHPGSFRNADKIIPLFKQLRDLHAVWTPDWTKAGELRKTLGDPEATWQDVRPNLAELERWEHAVRIQG